MSYYYNVMDFGASSDGETLNTKAFQAAIDACHENGGGVVLCEAGDYKTGSIDLKSNVELRLSPGCRLVGSTDIDDYKDFISEGFKHELAPEGTSKYLIGASHASNVAITGPGVVDVMGPGFYDQTKLRANGKFAEKPKQRPRAVMFHECRDVRFSETAYIDSPCWTFWLMKCDRMKIQGIRIDGDQRMINNDGLDIDSCKDVAISDCFIKTDDDCIVLRSIQNVFDTPKACENVVVSNCVLDSTCQCVRVSCPSDYVVRNCLLSNITMTSRVNGINFDFPNRYLAEGSKGGAYVENISFSDIMIDCGAHPLRICAQEGIELSGLKNISFSNMRMKSVAPCVIQGNEHSIIENVSFRNVDFECFGKSAIEQSYCKNIRLDNWMTTGVGLSQAE